MREKLQRFMMGRYGNDQLNNALIILALIMFVLQIIFKFSLFSILGYAFWLLCFYRMFSRQVYKRSNENVIYLNKTRRLRHSFSCLRKNMTDKGSRYFTCPSCGQIVRVPKGRGKIEITCPSCRHHFDRKS